MRQVLCVEEVGAARNRCAVKDVKKGEIYTPTREKLSPFGWVGYELAEREKCTYYAKCLFVELPDLSEEALEKEKQEQEYETNLEPALHRHHNCRCCAPPVFMYLL